MAAAAIFNFPSVILGSSDGRALNLTQTLETELRVVIKLLIQRDPEF